MPKSTKGLLAELSVIDRGPEKAECLRGGADFRDRLGGFAVWKLYQSSI